MCSDSAQFTFSLTHQGASKFGISSVGVSVTNAENIIYALPSLPTHMIFPFFHLGGAAAARKRCQEICQFGVGFPKKKESADAKKARRFFTPKAAIENKCPCCAHLDKQNPRNQKHKKNFFAAVAFD